MMVRAYQMDRNVSSCNKPPILQLGGNKLKVIRAFVTVVPMAWKRVKLRRRMRYFLFNKGRFVFLVKDDKTMKVPTR